MNLEFVKIHGAGNDFIVIDDLKNDVSLTDRQIAFLCDRHFGIGADGIILVQPSPHAERAAFMGYYNSDGTMPQMCGNGVRCFAKFLVDRGLIPAGERSFIADTRAGARPITFEVDEAGKLTTATVDMGQPVLDPALVPTTLQATEERGVVEAPLSTPWGEFAVTLVSMGNPHAVVFLDDDFATDALAFDLSRIGPYLECHEAFPERCNIEFAALVPGTDPECPEIIMRVWERGCGETLACGTGACATAVAANLTRRTRREAILKLRGGDLKIEWGADGHVMMTGPAEEVFTGQVRL
jgi:diaminopimelate epimerase